MERERLLPLAAALLSALVFTSCELPGGAISHTYLTWRSPDTSTTMTVIYHRKDDSNASQVLYDTNCHSGDKSKYPLKATGKKIKSDVGDRYVHTVELTGLTPKTSYCFISGDDQTGWSAEKKFKTLPADDTPIRFISGGDIGTDPVVAQITDMAAKQNPDFVWVGGDIAYADGSDDDGYKWDLILKLFEEKLVTTTGYTIPVVWGIGNHEVINDKDDKTPRERAPFYYDYLNQHDELTYFYRQFGSNMVAFFLDSHHIYMHNGQQLEWMKKTMPEFKHIRYRHAVYHVPLYPSNKAYDKEADLRNTWFPVFDAFSLTIGWENHEHALKRTKMLKGNQVVETGGTIYLGDGCWGKEPRETFKSWYMEKASSDIHVWVVDLSSTGTTYKALGPDGKVLDQYAHDGSGNPVAR